jgi:hypothetical protein
MYLNISNQVPLNASDDFFITPQGFHFPSETRDTFVV